MYNDLVINMERCPSGLWYMTRNHACGLYRTVGSNPTLSAKIKGSDVSVRAFLHGFLLKMWLKMPGKKNVQVPSFKYKFPLGFYSAKNYNSS